MLEELGALFSYAFMVRAFIAGGLVALCSALLGTGLVLKRYSMIGDGLSHTAFGATAVALALNVAPLWFSLPVVMLAAVLLLRLRGGGSIKGDAMTAVLSSASLAMGVAVISVVRGMNTDVNSYLFGSVLSLSETDAWISAAASAAVTILFLLFYNRIFAVTFDEDFLRAGSGGAGGYNLLVAMLTAVTVVVGMKMMGALLISSLIIFPAVTAMRVCSKFKSVVVFSACDSVVCFLAGMFASYFLRTPAGASVVLINLFSLIFFSCAGAVSRRVRKSGAAS